MPSVAELYPSKWLSKTDVQQPIQATIRSVSMETIKGQNGNETKPVLFFAGNIKPLILNKTSAMILESLYGSDYTAWGGKPIEIWFDPNVSFGGKITGGVRLRRPQGGQSTGMSYQDAQLVCDAAGISKEELISYLKSKGASGWKPMYGELVNDLVRAKQEVPFDSKDSTPDNGSDIPF